MVISNTSYLSLFLGAASSFLPNSHLPTLDYSKPSSHSFFHLKRADPEPHDGRFIAFAVLIPILVLLSGLFAGLTLGYMSLDETQLNVLSISGTAKQREYAEKIKPIRKNGHLLLVTLLLANMIVNETLPVIADSVLGGGLPSVVASTAMIVIFAEIIPQSLCTRHGLYIGAKMAGFVRVLIWTMGIISWPVAKLLEFILGPHHGIIYRRTELKELIAMHSSLGQYGGDLKTDTVTIIGATLDLQEKVVRQAMTPIKDVFMLSIDAQLDYDTLHQICLTGHSRVPVYEEVEVPTSKVFEARNKAGSVVASLSKESADAKFMTVKRIVGILLVKQCVLLDPGDAVPLRKIPLNKVPFVPNNEPLLGILDKFQEGRSHMAIVSRFSVDKAASVKQAAKQSLTQRLRHRVGISDDSSSDSESGEDNASKGSSKGGSGSKTKHSKDKTSHDGKDNEATLRGGDGIPEKVFVPEDEQEPKHGFPLRSHRGPRRGRSTRKRGRSTDLEMGVINADMPRPKARASSFTTSGLEQLTPADAVLAKEDAEDFLQILDPAIMPLGIITLEDVLEELIGEEIYDEFDPHHRGAQLSSYIPPESDEDLKIPSASSPPAINIGPPQIATPTGSRSLTTSPILKPTAVPALKGFNFLRSKSAPPNPRDLDAIEGVIGRSQTSATLATQSASLNDNPMINIMPTISLTDTLINDVAIPKVSHSPANISPALLPSALLPDSAVQVSVLPEGTLGRARSTAPETSLSPPIAAAIPSSGSPVPSLEAFLLDRKRRGVTPSGTRPPSSSSNVTVRVANQNPSKGKSGFKSSPIGGNGGTGVVVAEVVKNISSGPKENEQERTFVSEGDH